MLDTKRGQDNKMDWHHLEIKVYILSCVGDQVLASFTQRAEWIDTDGCLSENKPVSELVLSCIESGSRAEQLVIPTGQNKNKLRPRPLGYRVGRTWDDWEATVPLRNLIKYKK